MDMNLSTGFEPGTSRANTGCCITAAPKRVANLDKVSETRCADRKAEAPSSPNMIFRWLMGITAVQLYCGNRPPPDVRGRTAIRVDDDLATGATMHAAIQALRQQQPARIIVAVR
jgi:hypothetical protein